MGQIERCGRHVKSCACLVFILFHCLGCTTPGAVGTSAGKSPQQAAAQESSNKADRLLSVQAQERAAEVLIRLSANGPFKDYQFKKIAEDRFVLELGDISNRADLPALPPLQKMRLSYAGEQTQQCLQLVGTLSGSLDQYMLNSAGNDLVLALYVSQGTSTSSALPSRRPPDAGPKRKVPVKSTPAPVSVPQVSATPAVVVEGSPGAESEQAGTTLLKKQYTGKPISLDLVDADLKNVLRLLADISGTNIAIEPDVTGKVTLKVDQVPWDQVLDMIITMNELGKVQVGNVIRIARQEALKRAWDQQKDTLKAKQDFVEAAKDLGEISTAYLTVNYAPAADIASKIKEIMSDKGKLSVDERTSLIIFTDYDSRIENARRLLTRLDKATAQVMIEARVVTVSSDYSRTLGVKWALQTSHEGGGRYSMPSDLVQDISGGATNLSDMTQAFAINSGVGTLFNFAYGALIGKTLTEIDLQISALETAQQLKIMASPKVLTLNNVKAVISQGTQIPYAQFNEFGTAVGTQFVSAVLELAVTPHITPDRKVRMQINAKQDEPSASVVGAQGQPGIDTRKIDTQLLVDDGSVIVIGGVLRNRESSTRTVVPGLSRIPLLGRLFKSEDESGEKTELLIFISPRIVDSSRIPERG
jgi:type IV pilus assembly protein PilQ